MTRFDKESLRSLIVAIILLVSIIFFTKTYKDILKIPQKIIPRRIQEVYKKRFVPDIYWQEKVDDIKADIEIINYTTRLFQIELEQTTANMPFELQKAKVSAEMLRVDTNGINVAIEKTKQEQLNKIENLKRLIEISRKRLDRLLNELTGAEAKLLKYSESKQ